MFCSECGQQAGGKFCCHCGTPLAPAATPGQAEQAQAMPAEAEVVIDWDTEVCYETILRSGGVRKLVEQHAKLAPKRMSAEQFLQLADKLMPQAVSFEAIAALAQPISTRLGLKTGKQASAWIPASVARVIVRGVCSLARHGQALRGVTQQPDGCTIEAELPSDLLSMAGDLTIAVRRQGLGTEVLATTKIAGQIADWGKSRRALERLIADLHQAELIARAA
jgi:hypothetical protein